MKPSSYRTASLLLAVASAAAHAHTHAGSAAAGPAERSGADRAPIRLAADLVAASGGDLARSATARLGHGARPGVGADDARLGVRPDLNKSRRLRVDRCASGHACVAGEVVVRYLPGLDVRAVDAIGRAIAADARALGLRSMRRAEVFANGAVHRYTLPEGVSVREAVAALEADPFVVSAEPNYVGRLASVPNDPLYDNFVIQGTGFPNEFQRWQFNGIGTQFNNVFGEDDLGLNAEAFWEVQTGRPDVVIAIIDGGFSYLSSQQDLRPNLAINAAEVNGVDGVDDDNNGYIDDTVGWDFVLDGNDPFPFLGNLIDGNNDGVIDNFPDHGTSVASIAGARGDNGFGIAGAAWNCSLMNLLIADDEGEFTAADLAEAIRYAVDNGADVINMSLVLDADAQVVEDAVEYAEDAGVVLVASAGNDNTDQDLYPASYREVISVSASGYGGSVFGNLTPDFDGRAFFANYSSKVDVCAPGVGICALGVVSRLEELQTGQSRGGEDVEFVLGTSFAAPQVSGLAALLISEARDRGVWGVSVDADDIAKAILRGANQLGDDPDDVPDAGEHWAFWGRIDFVGAYEELFGPLPTP